MSMHSATRSAERRIRPDRRAKPTSFWSALRLQGQRRGFRRTGEGRCATVDCPRPMVIFLVLCVIVCSTLDALLTLMHIANGGGEANPVMALALTYGDTAFVSLKMGTTCFGVWLLSVFQYFPLAYAILHSLTLMYLGVMGLHAMLLLS